MAQAGYTPIQLYYSTTAAAVPVNTNLVSGELALNIQDEKLYFKNAAGTVKLLASNATSAPVLSFSAGTTGFTPNTATTGAVTLAGTLGTANGGTNLTSFTSGGVVYASSSSALATGSALTFDGTSLSTTGQILLNNNNYVGFKNTSGTAAVSIFNDTSNFLNLYNSGNTGTIFYVNAAEQMRLTSTGLGIGQTSPSVPLDVNRSSATSGLMLNLQNTSTGSFIQFAQPGVANLLFGCPNADAFVWKTFAGGTYPERMRLQAGLGVGTTSDPGAGAIYATGNITAFFSDKRLKTVSGKIENALDKVGKLSGVYYTFNDTAKSFGYDSDEEHVGVIAQEVEAVLPQIVKAAPFDLDENNNSKSGENYKTVQYDKLVPLLIEAINELQAKVKALEAK